MIIGYRTFKLAIDTHSPRLQSTASPYIWQSDKNQATHVTDTPGTICSNKGEHEVAQGRNTHCGFWAYTSPTEARDHANTRGSWVTVAAVLGWGNYSIGTGPDGKALGWRSEYSKIIALSHAMWDEMEQLSEYYKVPLVTFKGLTEFASHFGTTADEIDAKYDTPMPEYKPTTYDFSALQWSSPGTLHPNYYYMALQSPYAPYSLVLPPPTVTQSSSSAIAKTGPTWSGKFGEAPKCCGPMAIQSRTNGSMMAGRSIYVQTRWKCTQCGASFDTVTN